MKLLAVFALLLFTGCGRTPSDKVLDKNWNIISWLESTQNLRTSLPRKEIPWKSLISLQGQKVKGLPMIIPISSPRNPADMLIRMDPMPGEDLAGVEGRFTCPIPVLLRLEVHTVSKKKIKLASIPFIASEKNPLSFHFDLSGHREFQKRKVRALYLLWTPLEGFPATPVLVKLSHLRLLARKDIHDLDAATITTLSEKTGNYLLHSLALLLPPGGSVHLNLKGGRDAGIFFRGRSLTGEKSRIEFRQKKIFRQRALATFELGQQWTAQTLSLPDFSGGSAGIMIHNPSTEIVALSSVYFRARAHSLPRSIALLIFDSLRRDALGVYGYPGPTSPAMDAFAREHVIFERALSAGPQTPWAVSHMLTSCWGPFSINEAQRFPDNLKLLPKEIHRQGYVNIGFSENAYSSSAHNLNQGYDLFWELDTAPQNQAPNNGAIKSPEVLSVLHDIIPVLKQTGFFFYSHFLKPHFPYVPSPEAFQHFDFKYEGGIGAEIESPNSFLKHNWPALLPDDRRQVRALYDGNIRDCDEVFSAVYKEMENEGILKRTLLAVTSDHGEYFGEHFGFAAYNKTVSCEGNLHPPFLFQTGLAIPLFLSYPGDQPKRIAQMVSLIDLFPSFLDFANIPPPATIQGRSLFPLIAGAEWPRRFLFSTYGNSQRMAAALVDGNKKATLYLIRDKGKWIPAESGTYDISDFMEDVAIELPGDERRRLLDEIALFMRRQLPLIQFQDEAVSKNMTDAQIRQLKTLGYLQ